jgi:hypothetical protein
VFVLVEIFINVFPWSVLGIVIFLKFSASEGAEEV